MGHEQAGHAVLERAVDAERLERIGHVHRQALFGPQALQGADHGRGASQLRTGRAGGTEFHLDCPLGVALVKTQLVGHFNISNALAVLALLFGFPALALYNASLAVFAVVIAGLRLVRAAK